MAQSPLVSPRKRKTTRPVVLARPMERTRATSNSHRHKSSPERDPQPPQRRSARRETSSLPPGALPSRYPFLPRLGGAFARCASGGRRRTGVSGPDGLPANDPTLPVTQWETNHQTRNASASNSPWEREALRRGSTSTRPAECARRSRTDVEWIALETGIARAWRFAPNKPPSATRFREQTRNRVDLREIAMHNRACGPSRC